MIYLVSNTPFLHEKVINLKVCDIKFKIFNIEKKYDAIIFTSKNAVKALEYNQIMPSLKTDIYTIGIPTFKAAKNFGFENIYIGRARTGNAFACEISHLLVRKKRVLYLKAEKTVSKLNLILERDGVRLDCIEAYENKFVKVDISLKPPSSAVLIFTSPFNVECFVKNFGWDESWRAVAIGKITAQSLEKYCEVAICGKVSIKDCVQTALKM